LERLLEALDARHVAGWYHPAMRLQAQLQNAQGIATELREQLRFSRYIDFKTDTINTSKKKNYKLGNRKRCGRSK
jgi:hypothetical protein